MLVVSGTKIQSAESRHDSMIAAMEAKFFPQHALSATQVGYYRRREAALVVVALDVGGQITGYAIGAIVHRGSTTVLWIVSMATVRSSRRQGIGRKLLGYALRRGRSLGASSAKLHVRVANKAARRLYEATGFQVLRVVRDYYGKGEHAALMSRAPTARRKE